MGVEKERWLGPGETARRLGVSTKALKVYEREGLVVPHRAMSGWRLYGPAQVARLHQIIVLRDLGLSLQSIKKLTGSQSRLREVLALQRESLEAQKHKIDQAIKLIETAQRQLDEGRDLSLDDLATLTRETVVQHPITVKEFENRLEALVAERDPTGQANQAIAKLRAELLSATSEETFEAELPTLKAEARRLADAGDTDSEAAKQLARRFWGMAGHVKDHPTKAQAKLVWNAFEQAAAESEIEGQLLDPVAMQFLATVIRGMRARGELS